MGFKTKVQQIRRKSSRQFYINFPSACAQMMDLRKGELVEWVLTDNGDLLLRRYRDKQETTGNGESTGQE